MTIKNDNPTPSHEGGKTAETDWHLYLCQRTIEWCKENDIKYPGDIVMVPAFNVMKSYAAQEVANATKPLVYALSQKYSCQGCGHTARLMGAEQVITTHKEHTNDKRK